MSTLLVDNYDSYTYNVFHLLASVTGEAPVVVPNDAISWRALSRWDFDAIVLSPGPGRPERWHDFGVCADILRFSDAPVLGVCLGHQGLANVLGGTVKPAPAAMHGRLSRVRHDGVGLFAGIPQDFEVIRYHSLAVASDLGADGRVTAWTPDGVVMGIEHCRRPLWGVQFHPESIATEHGRRLVENFYEMAARVRTQRVSSASVAPAEAKHVPKTSGETSGPSDGHQITVRALDARPPMERLFELLFGESDVAFWLDSADAPTRLAKWSYIGTSAGAGSRVLEYDVERKQVSVRAHAGMIETRSESIFGALERELATRAQQRDETILPGFNGGYVGYLGYECKADCGSPNVHRSDLPDAVMMLANRVVAFDHTHGRTYLLASRDPGAESEQEVLAWLARAEVAVGAAASGAAHGDEVAGPTSVPASASRPDRGAGAGDGRRDHVSFRCGRGREQYLADIARCQAALAAGESYEVCLTDQISTGGVARPWELYCELRRSNPAPFAAYLKLPGFDVLSSSPERFLAIDRGRRVQARPIKGTMARESDPVRDEAARAELAADEKTYAEHLMIVDLLRNDLGRVCALDSVRVPELMVVEAYATLHQLTSTITGVLADERTPVECVRACFPGGSMTGAPKLRTMEIIDDLEREARGVYSGALGYFGFDGGVDLSIVIRTIVTRRGRTTIGAGGAIVLQSDPGDEFEEILLKARAPMAAIARTATGNASPEALTIELEPDSLAPAV